MARSLPDGWTATLLDIAPVAAADMPPGATAVVADVRDRSALAKVFAGADLVVHAAAGLPLMSAAAIRSVNEGGTLAVLEEAERAGVGRVVHVSSTAVYGIPDHHPLEEGDEMVGVGPYGESKVAAERLCEAARERGLCVPVVRPKTFIGPERLGVFRIPVIGSGDNRYQLLDVDDLVAAILLLLSGPAATANATFNVGAGRFSTVANDLGALFAHAGTGSRLLPTHAGLAKGTLAVLEALRLSPLYKWVYATSDQDSWVSTDRLEALGWAPRKSNAETLIRTYDWYLENRHLHKGTGKGHRAPWREGALGLLRRLL